MPKKPPLIDDSYGKFVVRFLWKLYSPMYFLLGIILLTVQIPLGIFLIVLGLIIGYFSYFKKRRLRED